MNIFSYERYNLPNSRKDKSYIYPVIMPIEGCERQKANSKKEFFMQPMYPLINKNDNREYKMDDILTNLAVGIHGLTKYEIDSPYKFHRPVPSARGIHPCELYFFSENKVKRYNPVDDSFDVLWKNGEDKNSDFSIVIAADDWRLAKFYGDFAYVLGALDAGHIIGQLAILSIKNDCYMEVMYSKAQDSLGNNVYSYFKKQGLVVYTSVLIRKKKKKKERRQYCIQGNRKLSYLSNVENMKYRNELIQLKKMKKLLNGYDRFIRTEKREFLKEENTETIKQILRKRTSAHSHVGLMSVGRIDSIDKKLMWIARELDDYKQKAKISSYVNIYFF